MSYMAEYTCLTHDSPDPLYLPCYIRSGQCVPCQEPGTVLILMITSNSQETRKPNLNMSSWLGNPKKSIQQTESTAMGVIAELPRITCAQCQRLAPLRVHLARAALPGACVTVMIQLLLPGLCTEKREWELEIERGEGEGEGERRHTEQLLQKLGHPLYTAQPDH